MTGELTGNFMDEGSIVLMELIDGTWIAADHRPAKELLRLAVTGESVTVEYESWQVSGRKRRAPDASDLLLP